MRSFTTRGRIDEAGDRKKSRFDGLLRRGLIGEGALEDAREAAAKGRETIENHP